MRTILVGILLLGVSLSWTSAQETPYPAVEVRASFLKLLDRPRVDADVQVVKSTPQPEDWVLEEFTFASEKKADGTLERVPTIVLRPKTVSTPMPAVIVLHGTGGNRLAMIPYMKELRSRGIIGVAIDARYHGARAGGAKGAVAYNEAISRAWRTKAGEPMEHPFYYDTVWDLWRLVDVLSKRPDIDPARIGMIGFSMGGIQTYMAASVDERVKVAVPAIAVQSFRWSLENDKWHARANTIRAAHELAAKDLGEPTVNARVCRELWNKIVPGILGPYDCPSMLCLFANRPLLILSGAKDPNCPIEGAQHAIRSATHAYRDSGDRLRVMIADVGHVVTPEQREASLDWFARWLPAKQ